MGLALHTYFIAGTIFGSSLYFLSMSIVSENVSGLPKEEHLEGHTHVVSTDLELYESNTEQRQQTLDADNDYYNLPTTVKTADVRLDDSADTVGTEQETELKRLQAELDKLNKKYKKLLPAKEVNNSADERFENQLPVNKEDELLVTNNESEEDFLLRDGDSSLNLVSSTVSYDNVLTSFSMFTFLRSSTAGPQQEHTAGPIVVPNSGIDSKQNVILNIGHDDQVFGNGVPQFYRMSRVNCAKLFAGDPHELENANLYQVQNPKRPIPDMNYVQLTAKCQEFVVERIYITKPVSREEADFPLAFSILMYKDVEQFERLLRAIYRPQNFYCVHIDVKASSAVHDAVRAIASCFRNIFVPQRLINVVWSMFSVLEAELICMEELLRYKWKYFINLTGQEFPLKTNLDIIKIVKVLNGSNNIEGTVER